MNNLYDTPPPNATANTASGAVRRRHSRKVRLTSRRSYRSAHAGSGGIRSSRRRRWKRYAFWMLCAALAGVLAFSYWVARRRPSTPTPLADPLGVEFPKKLR